MRTRQDPPTVFTLHIGAALGPEWVDWFDGLDIASQPDGTSVLTASIRDQAMLFGLLIRVRDLGIPLLGLYPGSESPSSSVQ